LLKYFREILGIEPWAGTEEKGQLELMLDIQQSVRRQLAGELNVPNTFRVAAGHGLGKTYGCAGIVNWFFDAFAPSVTITTAPTKDQVELLLWKDIKSQRRGARERGHKMPGRKRCWALGARPWDGRHVRRGRPGLNAPRQLTPLQARSSDLAFFMPTHRPSPHKEPHRDHQKAQPAGSRHVSGRQEAGHHLQPVAQRARP